MDNSQITKQLVHIEAILDVLLTLEKHRRAKEYDRPYEQVVIELEQMVSDARAAITDRLRLDQT